MGGKEKGGKIQGFFGTPVIYGIATVIIKTAIVTKQCSSLGCGTSGT